MSYREEALTFGCAGEALVGILVSPKQAGGEPTAADIGVVIIVGGPQYRAGSHRQFTLLARALAAAGYPVLRFDYRGMGDSTGAHRDFQGVSDDVGVAIDELQQRQPSVTRVVLWGLCDGASAALLYLHSTRDPRVLGLALANPWVRSEAGLARAQIKHYYLQRLVQPEFWRKVLSGQVGGKAAGEFWHKLSRSLIRDQGNGIGEANAEVQAPFQQRMAEAASDFRGKILLLISGNDLTAKEFLERVRQEVRWRAVMGRDGVTRRDFAHADHTFSNSEVLQALLQLTTNWLRSLDGQFVHAQDASDAAATTWP